MTTVRKIAKVGVMSAAVALSVLPPLGLAIAGAVQHEVQAGPPIPCTATTPPAQCVNGMTLGSVTYAPKDIVVHPGHAVHWTNTDARTGQKHSITSGTDPNVQGHNGDRKFDSNLTVSPAATVTDPLMPLGGEFSHTFTEVGEFPYFCKRAITDATQPTGVRYVHANAGMKGTVKVVYDFGGFQAPVDAAPTVNTAVAGRALPIKFSLSGDQGLDIFRSNPKAELVSCDPVAPLDAIEETVTAGSSGLSYDAATDTYTYVWKTDKRWAGTCRTFHLYLKDGTEQHVSFRF
jgi:plastocyanin